MSPPLATSATEARGRSRWPRHLRRLPTLLVLALIWILLWGTWTVANLLTGLAVAAGITLLLSLPRAPSNAGVHVGGLLAFGARMAVDLVRSSIEVSWLAIRPGPSPKAAVVVVRLRSSSDFIMTAVAEAVTLVPGSFVLELMPERRLLVAHVIDMTDADDVEAYRRGVLAMEAQVIRAVGGRDEVRLLEADAASSPTSSPSPSPRGSP